MTQQEIADAFATIHKRSMEIVRTERAWVRAETSRLQLICGGIGHVWKPSDWTFGTERITLALVSIACLTATVLPRSVEREVVTVRVPAKTPTMFYACDRVSVQEHQRACHQRRKSI
jgi:hypothetical protein